MNDKQVVFVEKGFVTLYVFLVVLSIKNGGINFTFGIPFTIILWGHSFDISCMSP